MAITRYARRPFTPWAELDELNDLMNRFFVRPTAPGGAASGMTARTAGDWTPAVNVVETPDTFELTAELPGLGVEDVEIDFQNDVLSIRGEKVEVRTEEDDKRRYHMWERRSGSFQRSFTLPGIDGEKIAASFVDGVLKIELPKAAETKARRIEITPRLES